MVFMVISEGLLLFSRGFVPRDHEIGSIGLSGRCARECVMNSDRGWCARPRTWPRSTRFCLLHSWGTARGAHRKSIRASPPPYARRTIQTPAPTAANPTSDGKKASSNISTDRDIMATPTKHIKIQCPDHHQQNAGNAHRFLPARYGANLVSFRHWQKLGKLHPASRKVRPWPRLSRISFRAHSPADPDLPQIVPPTRLPRMTGASSIMITRPSECSAKCAADFDSDERYTFR